MTTQMNKRNESGNALFLILIAVALFAALSYAVTQSGRGGGTIDKEQGLISASQITQYPAAIRTGVTRMVITGTQVSALNFDTTSGTGVFAADGGGVVEQDPPANIGTATAWAFKSAPATATGWFISGVGTDVATGKDVFAYLNGVTLNICSQILRGLGLSPTPLVEATAVDFTGTNDGLSTQTGGGTNANTAGNNAYSFDAHNADPQAFACVRNGAAGNYVYFHALVEQ